MLMADSMKMKVVASGVEADDQLSFLRETHCDEAQGYLFRKTDAGRQDPGAYRGERK